MPTVIARRFARPLALLLPLAIAFPARATEAAPPPAATLLAEPERLVEWLERAHPDLAADAARTDAARAELAQAGTWRNPELDLAAGNVAVGPSRADGGGLRALWSVGVAQEFELGKRGPRTEGARLRLAASREEHAARRGRAAADARRSLAEVVWLAARQQVLAEGVALADEASRVASSRHRLGDASGADLARFELEAARLRAEQASNEAALDAARSACASRVALPCDLGAEAAPLLRTAAPVPPLDKSDALERRPERRALELRSRAAGEDATLAARRAIPDPKVRIGLDVDRFGLTNEDPYTVGIGISVPLPLLDRGRNDEAAARAAARELAHEARADQLEARERIDGLERRREALGRSLALLENDAVPRAETIAEAARTAFERGEYGTTELLLARRDRIDLQLQLLDVTFALFDVRNELRQGLGLDSLSATRSR